MRVFDTSAVLAIYYNEPGRGQAQSRLGGAAISVVNVAEVVNDIIRSGTGDAKFAISFLDRLALQRLTPDQDQAQRAGELKLIRGLSLGDCFCIALAESRREPLVTADQQWRRVPQIQVPLEMIR